jgi:hypothetical protein
MAKQGFDFKKLALASLLPVGVGVVLVIISLIIQLLAFMVNDANGAILDMANLAFALLLIPVFLALMFWTGMRAAKNYGFDAVGAASAAAVAFFVIGLVELVLQSLLAAIVVTRPMGSGTLGSPALALASSVFGGAMGMSGVALSAVCGLGILLLGVMINFVIGGFGALFALRGKDS